VKLITCSAKDDCVSGVPGGFKGTREEFGERRDGKVNRRCQLCRQALASAGGRELHAREPVQPRDYKALAVVERWCGMRYRDTKAWTTPEAILWQWHYVHKDGSQGISLQDVWTARMMRLAERAQRCEAARQRIKDRQLNKEAA
jgi:hypothetical protein